MFAIETFGSTGRGYIVDDVSLCFCICLFIFKPILLFNSVTHMRDKLTKKQVGIYGYGLSYSAPSNPPLTLSTAKRLHKTIRENFGTIVFCRRYLERLGVEKYLAGVSSLSLKLEGFAQ